MNNLITAVILIVFTVIVTSCSTTTHLRQPVQEKFAFEMIEGYEYFIANEYKDAIQNCLAENEDVRLHLIEYRDPDVKIDESKIDKENIRNITRDKDAYSELPWIVKHSTSGGKFLICYNQLGTPILSKLIKTNLELSPDEKEALHIYMMDYRFDERANANCLECIFIWAR